MKPSVKKLRYLIKDEKQASKMYSRYGFTSIAKDERNHRKMLQKLLRKEMKE